MSNGSQTVLLLVLAIAAFELGITGKLGTIWGLAFSSGQQEQMGASQPQLHPTATTTPTATGTPTTAPPVQTF